MANTKTNYSDLVGNRIKSLIELLGLEIAGFAVFTKISESHIYAIINGNRKLTGEVADQMTKDLPINGWQLLQLDYEITSTVKNSRVLKDFYKNYSNNSEYFIDNRTTRKSSQRISDLIKKDATFKNEQYVWEIREYLKQHKINPTSKELAQILKYLVVKGELQSKKAPLKLRNGLYGERMVDVYFK